MTKDHKDPNEKSVTVTDTTKVTKDKDIAVEGGKPDKPDHELPTPPDKPDHELPTPPDKPDNTLPKPPGTPGHELPDREKPVDPGHGIDAGGKPDNTLPPEPDQSLPPEHPGEPTQPIAPGGPPPGVATLPVPPGTPTHPITGEPEVPDQTLPPALDNSLPAFVADTRTIAEQLSEGPMTPEIAERLAKQEKK